jgi:hypothetical protein
MYGDYFRTLGTDGKPIDERLGSATGEANARLMASAPDLLQACQRVHKYLNHPNDGAGRATVELCLSELSAAIARATGGVQ